MIHKTFLFVLGKLFFDLPARTKNYPQLIDDLDLAGQRLRERFKRAAEVPENHKVLTHIIGIERWGQRRLTALLGAPLKIDEYNNDRPARETPWAELRTQLQLTRQQTITLAQQLQAAGVNLEATMPHNDFGDLTVRAWLNYLKTHAELESKKAQ
jgi:hypothetical protein